MRLRSMRQQHTRIQTSPVLLFFYTGTPNGTPCVVRKYESAQTLGRGLSIRFRPSHQDLKTPVPISVQGFLLWGPWPPSPFPMSLPRPPLYKREPAHPIRDRRGLLLRLRYG